MGYDYILSKGQDNILLSNNKLDITEDVIKGLNKRYKNKK
jgi:Skp family chaperone for outer membrane proteins